jgi:hypothetical protein
MTLPEWIRTYGLVQRVSGVRGVEGAAGTSATTVTRVARTSAMIRHEGSGRRHSASDGDLDESEVLILPDEHGRGEYLGDRGRGRGGDPVPSTQRAPTLPSRPSSHIAHLL